MADSRFVYVTYIRTTPEKVWEALTVGNVMKQYWFHENVSDWKPGSPWEHVRSDGSGMVDIVGKVIECSPPRKLIKSWAYPADRDNPAKTSRVTYEIEPLRDVVRLTVMHEELDPGSKMLESISKGWPMVLSGLKSLLETGTAIPKWW